MGDAERTAIMVDLLHARHYQTNGNARSHVVLEEVAPSVGWARRWSDVLVLSCWPSEGLTLDGFEVKASRADLKRELADADKHQATARYCDTWNLLVWNDAIHKGFEIPADWGLWIVEGDEDGRWLRCVRKAAKRTPEAWPRGFICSMVRNAYEQSPGAAWVARVAEQAVSRIWAQRNLDVQGAKESAINPIARALYGESQYRWPAEARDPDKVIALAVERLKAPPAGGGFMNTMSEQRPKE